MGISRANLSKLVQNAFGKLGDLPLTITYTYVTPGTYDPAADALTNTTSTVTGVPAVNVALKEQELDWFPADINTQKLLIAGIELPTVPKASDYVTINGVEWQVRRVSRVPGDSLYIIYIQEA